ncbi:hypothetical protein F5Y18DRAFT_390808 [Xylariaceae sp. FL1019]|nr:hypothetical protein F5Y18DRAFT_390808 [Xylariaceae sp. FL1019]
MWLEVFACLSILTLLCQLLAGVSRTDLPSIRAEFRGWSGVIFGCVYRGRSTLFATRHLPHRNSQSRTSSHPSYPPSR